MILIVPFRVVRQALITPVFESGMAAIPTDTPPNTTPALSAANVSVPRRMTSPFVEGTFTWSRRSSKAET